MKSEEKCRKRVLVFYPETGKYDTHLGGSFEDAIGSKICGGDSLLVFECYRLTTNESTRV